MIASVWSRLLDRIAGAGQRREEYERRALPFAGIAFVIGLVVSLSALHIGVSSIRWAVLIAVLLVGVPLTMLTNSLEVMMAARAVDRTVALGSALVVAVTGTAANLLPIPGALLVRTSDLMARGAKARMATRAQVGVGLLWNSVSVAGVGIVAQVMNTPWVWPWWVGAGVFLGLGVLALPTRYPRLILSIVAVEVLSVTILGLRLWAVFTALGIHATFAAGVAVAAANALSALIWIVPSGLAIRETLGSLLARLVGVSSVAGFSAQAIDRIIGMLGHLAAAILARRRLKSRSPLERGSHAS